MKYAFENNEIKVDTSGTECPIPVLRARKICQTASKGKIIKIIATDPLAEADFRHYCEQSGYEFIDIKKDRELIYIRFKI
jgi:tRNA 2-thiouridine synthesizing protein A